MYYPIVKIPLNIQFAITEKIYLPTLPNEPIKPQIPQEEADTFSHLWGRGCLFYFAYIVIYWVVRLILSMLNVEIPTEIQSILTLISSLWCVIWAFLGLLVPNKEKQQLRFQKRLDEYRKKQEKYHQEEREYNSVRNILNNKEKYIKEQRLIKTRNGFY